MPHAIAETVRCVIGFFTSTHIELGGNRRHELDRLKIRTFVSAITPGLNFAESAAAPSVFDTRLYHDYVGCLTWANGQFHIEN